jgi:hypothetical protein
MEPLAPVTASVMLRASVTEMIIAYERYSKVRDSGARLFKGELRLIEVAEPNRFTEDIFCQGVT